MLSTKSLYSKQGNSRLIQRCEEEGSVFGQSTKKSSLESYSYERGR